MQTVSGPPRVRPADENVTPALLSYHAESGTKVHQFPFDPPTRRSVIVARARLREQRSTTTYATYQKEKRESMSRECKQVVSAGQELQVYGTATNHVILVFK